MWRGAIIGMLICGADSSWAQSPKSPSLMDNAERDELAWVADDDPAMNAAIAKARATLPAFLDKAARPALKQREFSLKVRVPLDDGDNEYLWVRRFTARGDDFVGLIDSEPRIARHLKLGGLHVFRRVDIADWMYLEGGRMIGNYTMCAMLTRAPSERPAFRARFGLECSDE